MAARLRKTHQEDVKKKIQASQLINFLQNHALEDKDASPTRIDAAKFLLNKLISNAPTEIDQKTELTGDMRHAHVVAPTLSKEDWIALHLKHVATATGSAE